LLKKHKKKESEREREREREKKKRERERGRKKQKEKDKERERDCCVSQHATRVGVCGVVCGGAASSGAAQCVGMLVCFW
jgi:hypothetical protein